MTKRSTKRVTNSTEATLKKLEEEAKEFSRKTLKSPTEPETEKPLTPREHLAGLVLAGLLARSQGFVNQSDLVKEAFEWADRMREK